MDEHITEQYVKTLKEFLTLVLKHLSSFKVGNKEQNTSLIDLAKMISTAQTQETLSNIRKEYRELIIRIDQSATEETEKAKKTEGLLGSFFKKKPASADIKLVEEDDTLEACLLTILSAFAKGTLLMLEDDHPLNEPLQGLKLKQSEAIKSDNEKLTKDIVSFFFSKSNEATVVEREKNQLKDIIAALTSQIANLSISSTTFNSKITEYAVSINEAMKLDEIVDIKNKIFNETKIIQQQNKQVVEHIKRTEERLNDASEKIEQLEQELLKTKMEMMHDPLTQAYNRRAFDQKIEDQMNRFKRYRDPFAFIMFDLDHFKKVNDTYGHPAGDLVLKTVVTLASDSIRVVDFLARLGGEEFGVILEKVQPEEAFDIAEKIRKTIEAHKFTYKKQNVPVRLSIGIANANKEDTFKTLVKRADNALYKAKKEGRNRSIMI